MKQGDKIYKPFSLREFEFYEYLKTWDNPPRFFPKYFGRTQIPGEGDTINRTPLFQYHFFIFPLPPSIIRRRMNSFCNVIMY